MPALVVLGRANKRCEKRCPQYTKNNYLAILVFIAIVSHMTMQESIIKQTKGEKMSMSQEDLIDCLEPLIEAIDNLRYCFQGGLESKTMHQTVEEIRVELSEIDSTLFKLAKAVERLNSNKISEGE